MKLRLTPILAFVVLILASCTREHDPLPSTVDEIFPLVDGKYRIYHAIDTNYSSTAAGGKEGREFFKREMYNGEETDLLGRQVKRLDIHESPYLFDSVTGAPAYAWTFAELWTQYADAFYAECTEGNKRLLYLKIPPNSNATWNGNLYNGDQAQTYRYLNIDTNVTVGGVMFEHCVYVEEVAWDSIGSYSIDFLRKEWAYQIYAPYVGKIVRHREAFSYQSGGVEADKSFYLHEEITGHNF